MRTIPAALKAKLQNRFKASSTDSAPSIRLVATQTSVNTLLTEPIHEDIPANLGDVCVRQMEGDADLALAYAICIDNGVATIWRRKFPASMDYKWESVFELGSATDGAIEFDGTWKMNSACEWYYLQTEQFPYIFTVESGSLYVQKWRDASTRLLLAENVSQISVCKGWSDSVNPDNDQGLVAGYIRDGKVFYRSFAYSSVAGYKSWGIEHEVAELGSGNETLSVIRTNDFRIGFLTEKSGTMQMALTMRTYPGMSVKPEGCHVSADANFALDNVVNKYGYSEESATVKTTHGYFLMDGLTDSRMQIASAERILDENNACTGVKVFLDHALATDLTASFVAGCTCSYSNVTVSDVAYSADEQALVYLFAWKSGITPHKMAAEFSVSCPTSYDVSYYVRDGMRWYVEALSATLAQETEEHYAYGAPEYASVATTEASLAYIDATFTDAYAKDEHAEVGTTATTFIFTPAGDIPL